MDTEHSLSDISHVEIPLRWELSVLLESIKVTQVKENPRRRSRRRKLDLNGEDISDHRAGGDS